MMVRDKLWLFASCAHGDDLGGIDDEELLKELTEKRESEY